MKLTIKEKIFGIITLGTVFSLSGCQYLPNEEKVFSDNIEQSEQKVKVEEAPQVAYEKVTFEVKLTNNKIMLFSSPNTSSTLYQVGDTKSPFKLNETVKVIEQGTTDDAIYYKLADSIWVNKKDVELVDQGIAKVQALLDKEYDDPDIAVFVKSLTTNKEAGINADEQYVAASTGKLPIIYYTQKLISDKKVNPKDTFKNDTSKINEMPLSYQQEGAGILQNKPDDQSYSIDEVLKWTIEYSDNQGTNFLAYYVGNQYDKEMRDTISKIIGRKWETPFEITAKENGQLIESIYHLGGRAIEYMKNTEYDDERIPKYLPVEVAHKIGDVEDCEHDVAIVFAEKPYVLSIMTKNYAGYEKISKLSEKIYKVLGP